MCVSHDQGLKVMFVGRLLTVGRTSTFYCHVISCTC